jgi:hypothetical protein
MILSVFQNLLSFFFKKSANDFPSPDFPPEDNDLDSLISKAQVRLSKFLITRSVPLGPVKKNKDWVLSRSGEGLYKIEGKVPEISEKESGDTDNYGQNREFSVLIYTGGFLNSKAGKLTGLIHIGESDLCNALHANRTAAEILSLADSLSDTSKQLIKEVFNKTGDSSDLHPPALEDLAQWEDFDIYQTLIHVHPNTVAHVLIHSSVLVQNRIKSQLSKRFKETLVLEIQSLLSSGAEGNPFSKVRGLTQFDAALEDFKKQMHDVMLKKYTRINSKLLSS